MKIHEQIIKAVNEIISPVYLVGGACRDILLYKEPKDYDFTTPLSPDEIEDRVRKAGRRPYLIGKKFGTVGFKVSVGINQWAYVEVTTFRSEQYTPGNRKPEVEFVSALAEDLKRRDFTINSIASKNFKVIDPFDGQKDLVNKIIKCVGIPTHRFKEDPLRMLRACRFASTLGFDIEEKTFNSMKKHAIKILEVSKERWGAELDKLLVSDNPVKGLRYLMESRLLHYMIPELGLQYKYDQNSPHHNLDLWEHTLKVVENIEPDQYLRWSALLHDVGKPFVQTRKKHKDQCNYIHHELIGKELVLKIARHLKWSNDQTKNVSELVGNHLKEGNPLWDADSKGHV